LRGREKNNLLQDITRGDNNDIVGIKNRGGI
jgi:hypothetical protein